MWGSADELLTWAEGRRPDGETAAALATLDAGSLSVDDRLRLVRCWARLGSWVEAKMLRATALIAGPASEDGRLQAAALIGTTLHMSRVTARNRVEFAASLDDRLPATLDALEAGRVNLAQVRAIEEATALLGRADARVVEQKVLPGAGNRTPATLRKQLRRHVLTIDPTMQKERRERAACQRNVRFELLDDGMAELAATLPAGVAVRCRAMIEKAAHARPDCGEGIDARRADAFADLILATSTLTIELILHGTEGQPVNVPGIGPLDAGSIKDIVGPAAKIVVRPIGVPTGPVSTYRPSVDIDRWVRATDPTCRFPGCNIRSQDCDLDHVIPWDRGGPTSHDNLMPLCRTDHRLKTHFGWKPTLHPDRSVTWTTPTGQTIGVPPPDD